MKAPADPQPSPRRTPSAFGPALFALVLILAAAVYAWSVLDTSRGPQDWMMIVPAAALCIAALIWAGTADIARELARRREGVRTGTRDASLLPPALLVLICAYAPATALIGFDVATAIFICLALVIQGERRPLPLALAALGGTALLIWTFTGPLAVRLPTTFV